MSLPLYKGGWGVSPSDLVYTVGSSQERDLASGYDVTLSTIAS